MQNTEKFPQDLVLPAAMNRISKCLFVHDCFQPYNLIKHVCRLLVSSDEPDRD